MGQPVGGEGGSDLPRKPQVPVWGVWESINAALENVPDSFCMALDAAWITGLPRKFGVLGIPELCLQPHQTRLAVSCPDSTTAPVCLPGIALRQPSVAG
jgi:hypothetical protein